jgi:hypothetical protein
MLWWHEQDADPDLKNALSLYQKRKVLPALAEQGLIVRVGRSWRIADAREAEAWVYWSRKTHEREQDRKFRNAS